MSSDLARIEKKVNQIEIGLKRLVLLLLEELYGYGLSIAPFEDLTLDEIFQKLDDESFQLIFGDEGEEDEEYLDEEEEEDPLGSWGYVV